MRIFLVAFYKSGVEGIFKRIHLQTFYTDLQKAKEISIASFDDEAGFYNGVLIEEREENSISFHGTRVFLQLGVDGKLAEIPEPKCYERIINLI